jgi:hypothetical protein
MLTRRRMLAVSGSMALWAEGAMSATITAENAEDAESTRARPSRSGVAAKAMHRTWEQLDDESCPTFEPVGQIRENSEQNQSRFPTWCPGEDSNLHGSHR